MDARSHALLLRLHAALHGEPGRVLVSGICIGVGVRAGGRVRYCKPDGAALGIVDRVGGEVVLRDVSGRVLERFRVQRR